MKKVIASVIMIVSSVIAISQNEIKVKIDNNDGSDKRTCMYQGKFSIGDIGSILEDGTYKVEYIGYVRERVSLVSFIPFIKVKKNVAQQPVLIAKEYVKEGNSNTINTSGSSYRKVNSGNKRNVIIVTEIN